MEEPGGLAAGRDCRPAAAAGHQLPQQIIYCRIRQRSPWVVCDDDSMDEEVIPILRVEDATA
ncbi:hypothetical protein ABT303_36900, partial [Streptomyces coelicoflavus]